MLEFKLEELNRDFQPGFCDRAFLFGEVISCGREVQTDDGQV